MGFKRLEKNLIDIIKEEQAKLGFRKEEIRLYYPLISLNHFFEADDDVDEMQTRLEQFPEEVKEKTRRYLCDAQKRQILPAYSRTGKCLCT